MRILLVEDNPVDVALFRLLLDNQSGEAFDFQHAGRLSAAVECLAQGSFDVVLLDLGLPDAKGMESITQLQAVDATLPIVVLTDFNDERFALEAVKAGAQDYLIKGRFEGQLLGRALRYAIQRKRHERQIEQLNRVYAALYHVNQAIIRSHTRAELFSATCHALVESGGFKIAWIGWHDPSTNEIRRVSECADDSNYLTHIRIYADQRPEGGGPCGIAFREARTCVCNDFMTDSRTMPWRDAARKARISAGIALPVRMAGKVEGILAVYATEKGFFGEKEIDLLEEAAKNVSFALDNLEREGLRKRAEARVHQLAELLDKAPEAIVIADLDQRITFWNEGAERLFGWTATEMMGQPLTEAFALCVASDAETINLTLATHADWRGEVHGHDRSGKPVVIETSVTTVKDELSCPSARLCISSDITEKKQLEEQLLRAQRMESLGMLSAGISHDLNNILAPIRMAVPLLRRYVSDEDGAHFLEILETSAVRGADLVRQILSFAQGTRSEPTITHVDLLFKDICGIIRSTFPKCIVLEQHLPKDLWPIRVNATQIHQVLLNLCVNARDAMPKGTLHLRAENCELDTEAAEKIKGALPGKWVVFHVEDAGTGITPENLARIWDPFFTTKPNHKGTGLGLSTVRGIVEAHRGFLTVQSQLGQGTTFRIYLPAAQSVAEDSTDKHSIIKGRGHGELILLVDDEDLIRTLAKKVLTTAGYRVITACDGKEAAILFAAHMAEISLVITDLDMPKLDGNDLCRGIHALDPTKKIVAMSGLTGASPSKPWPEEYVSAVVEKPFTPETLVSNVQQALKATSFCTPSLA